MNKTKDTTKLSDKVGSDNSSDNADIDSGNDNSSGNANIDSGNDNSSGNANIDSGNANDTSGLGTGQNNSKSIPVADKEERKIASPPKKINPFSRLIGYHSLIVLGIAFCASFSVNFLTATQTSDFFWAFFNSAIILLPTYGLLAIYNHYISKYGKKSLETIISTLAKIADGDFSTRIDTDESKVFHGIYNNINTLASELESMQILKSDFINNVSHEFKTPISSINGFAQLLLNQNSSPEEVKEYLQIIYDESTRLSKLCSSITMLSRLESQKVFCNKIVYSLDEQLKKCAIILSPKWNEKKINLTCELVPTIYYGEPDIMQQVWINLITNAITYTPENGSVYVACHYNEKEVIIEVADSGVGMSEEQLKKIFEKYFQVGNIKNSGLGLGLSIVKKIVERYDGTITVTSAPSKGSKFVVALPYAQPRLKKIHKKKTKTN